MKDLDIHASRPSPAAAIPIGRRRPLWPWMLAATVVFLALIVGASLAALASLADGAGHGWHIAINGGEPWTDGWSLGLGPEEGVWAVVGVGLALLTVLIIVPLAVIFALLLSGLGIALGLAAAIGAIGLVVLLLFSPLWLIGLLLWLVLRRSPARMSA